MKGKTFDCVAMKRAGAAQVYELTKGMTFEERVRFWRRESAAFLREQRLARARKKTARKSI